MPAFILSSAFLGMFAIAPLFLLRYGNIQNYANGAYVIGHVKSKEKQD
jgi:hypothetical protein